MTRTPRSPFQSSLSSRGGRTSRFSFPSCGRCSGYSGGTKGQGKSCLVGRVRSAELSGVGPASWSTLCERFGRNARILDWARQLLAGKTPGELRKVMVEAGTKLPMWKDQPHDDDNADDLMQSLAS